MSSSLSIYNIFIPNMNTADHQNLNYVLAIKASEQNLCSQHYELEIKIHHLPVKNQLPETFSGTR